MASSLLLFDVPVREQSARPAPCPPVVIPCHSTIRRVLSNVKVSEVWARTTYQPRTANCELRTANNPPESKRGFPGGLARSSQFAVRSSQSITYLTPSAPTYSPSPKTACVTRLLSLACAGLGVLDAAMPRLNDGCMMKKGNTTVPMP